MLHEDQGSCCSRRPSPGTESLPPFRDAIDSPPPVCPSVQPNHAPPALPLFLPPLPRPALSRCDRPTRALTLWPREAGPPLKRHQQQGKPGEYYPFPTEGLEQTRYSKIWRGNDTERVLVVVDRGKEDPIEKVCVKDKKWLELRKISVQTRTKTLASDYAQTLSIAALEMSFGTIFGEDLPAFVAPLTLSLRSQTENGSPHYVITGQPSDRSFDIEIWFDSTNANAL